MAYDSADHGERKAAADRGAPHVTACWSMARPVTIIHLDLKRSMAAHSRLHSGRDIAVTLSS
jgi:hypothetical protein